MIDPLERIIWSADVESVKHLHDAVQKMPELRSIKIDRLFVERAVDHGYKTRWLIGELFERGLQVFYDAKFVEIPSKLEELAKNACRYSPWMLNCMAGCLSNGVTHDPGKAELDGLARFANVCLKADVKPCAVTVLTSKSPPIVHDEFKRTPTVQVLFYVEKIIKAGFTDVVCSPQEAHSIKQMFGDAITINCPGIRLPSAEADDQARIATPSGAVAAGADRLVIGRPITNGQLSKIIDDLAAPLHGKGQR